MGLLDDPSGDNSSRTKAGKELRKAASSSDATEESIS
jgi:hypothetical protein